MQPSTCGSLPLFGLSGPSRSILTVPLLPGGSPGGAFGAALARPPGTAAIMATTRARSEINRTESRHDRPGLVATMCSFPPPCPYFWNRDVTEGAGVLSLDTLADHACTD